MHALTCRPILNQQDRLNHHSDSSDYAQSILSFFPHAFHSYHDTSISLHSYQHNAYHPRATYMGRSRRSDSPADSPLRSLLPLGLIETLTRRIHSQHTLNHEVKTEKSPENVVVIHAKQGLYVVDRKTGGSASDGV